MVAPELAGEGLALTASAASKLGTLAKQEQTLGRVVSVCENAKANIDAISEKMAGLNKKMEDLLHKESFAVRYSEFPVDQPIKFSFGDQSPSENFTTKLTKEIGRLTEQEQKFIANNRISIDPVRHILIERGDDKSAALGLWKFQDDAKDKVIRIAEEIPYSPPRGNPDIAHAIRHELGHAYNDLAGNGRPLSDEKGFRDVFKTFFDSMSDELQDELRLSAKFKTINEARHEAFADLFAHANGAGSNNPFSQRLLEAFTHPDRYDVLDYIKQLRKDSNI